MEIRDAEVVAEIHLRSWQESYRGLINQSYLDAMDLEKRAAGWRNGLVKGGTLIRLVAEDGGEVVGFLTGLDNRKPELTPNCDSELWAIYVKPGVEGRGVGKVLLAEFFTRLRALGKKRCCVWVLEGNTRGRKFYESRGGELASAVQDLEIGGDVLREAAYEFAL